MFASCSVASSSNWFSCLSYLMSAQRCFIKWQNSDICFGKGCLRCKLPLSPPSVLLPLCKALAVGDEVFGSLVMNCILLQMAHCCISSSAPLITHFVHGLLLLFYSSQLACVPEWDVFLSIFFGRLKSLMSSHNVNRWSVMIARTIQKIRHCGFLFQISFHFHRMGIFSKRQN